MLRGILAAQGKLKARRAARRPALRAFRFTGTYPYIHWLCTLSNAIVGGLGLK